MSQRHHLQNAANGMNIAEVKSWPVSYNMTRQMTDRTVSHISTTTRVVVLSFGDLVQNSHDHIPTNPDGFSAQVAIGMPLRSSVDAAE